MLKDVLICILLFVGIIYSILLSFLVGLYISFILILITIGFASTIYLLDKKFDYKIIFYVWIAIIVTAISTLMVAKAFQMLNL